MLDSAPGGPLPSQLLQQRYGFGYFHGENSGFASDGYDRVHGTWRHWMPFLAAEVGAGARLLDLGCAYGFLVVEALEAGFRALGVDASRFALAQAARHAAPAAGRLVAAHAERLPLADASCDVVTAFDVLEHVPRPELLIAEAARVLRPGGLFVAATPDPLLFERDEPTHVAERPPSWWVRTLEQAGLATGLRFFQAPWNCELVARRGGPAPIVSYDALGSADPVLAAEGSPAPRLALRAGFGEPSTGGGRVVGDGAVVYVLNPGSSPLDVEITVLLDEPAALALALDGRIVGRGAATRELRARVLVPAGGHDLRFAIEQGWARLRLLRATAAPARHEDLCLTLPFDMYDRYALAARAAAIVAPDAKRLLDVGGTMGAGAGHLAWTGDFFPVMEVEVVDARPADHPAHRVLDPHAPLPFSDGAFPLVTALDVLEHVPAAEREAWLAELWRVTGRWLLLANPFATPGVREADEYLFELIRTRYGYEHRFLAEHLRHGHPELDATRRFFVERGASVAVLPSGYLPAWALLQTLNAWLSHPEQDQTYALANRLANRALGLASTVAPAYRHLLVIDRSGADHSAALEALVARRTPDLEAVAAAINALTLTVGDAAR
ncbi:MAG: methyltransferase domain-containing protein [Thermodesulfobacteriota bacterium]